MKGEPTRAGEEEQKALEAIDMTAEKHGHGETVIEIHDSDSDSDLGLE